MIKSRGHSWWLLASIPLAAIVLAGAMEHWGRPPVAPTSHGPPPPSDARRETPASLPPHEEVRPVPSSAAPILPSVTEVLRRVGPHTFELERSAFEAWGAHYQALTSPFAQMVSSDPTGTVRIALRPPGAVLTIVRATPDTFWSRLGLREGDELVHVNGVATSSSDGWLELARTLFERPSRVDHLELECARQGTALTPLHVRIVGGPAPKSEPDPKSHPSPAK